MAIVAVFCGSRDGANPRYKTLAYELGKSIAKRWHTLIYGGGNRWLMGAVAQWTHDGWGRVIGVTPRFLEKRERNVADISFEDELVFIETMDERKVILYGRADIVITLPGGFGTMDEFFEVLTLRQLDQYEKPIGILNVAWFYDPLVQYLHHVIEEWFVSVPEMELVIIRDEIEDLLDNLWI